jgi:hypothetical protein
MSTYFFDSSGIIKRYIREKGTDFVRQVTTPTAQHTVMIAAITPVEVASAFRRLQREEHLTAASADRLLRLFAQHTERDYVRLGLTDEIVSRATALLAAHPLRAYDAVQLASADISNTRLTRAGHSPLTFVTADTRLADAGRAIGLTTYDPNTSP